MGKNNIRNNGTRLTTLLLAVLISTQHANAYWRWNYDWKTLIQVVANTTAAAGVEGAHNATVSEQKKKQERIAEYTTAIHVIRELYKESMQNTGGFGQESRYYQLIGENALYRILCGVLVPATDVLINDANPVHPVEVMHLSKVIQVQEHLVDIPHDPLFEVTTHGSLPDQIAVTT